MRQWSIARRLFVGQLLFIIVLTVTVVIVAYLGAREQTFAQAAQRTANIAATLADSPLLPEAARSADPSSLLQPYASDVQADTGVDFITIMAPDRTRWTHPIPEEIGRPYIGSVQEALNGRSCTETTAGALGPSVRTITPVMAPAASPSGSSSSSNEEVVAMVSVGVTVSAVDIAFTARVPAILGAGGVMLIAGGLASWLVGRYLRRVTLGHGPEQLGQLFGYYHSVLHALQEGVVLTDSKGKIVLYNDPAARLLDLPLLAVGAAPPALESLPLPEGLRTLLRTGRQVREEIHVCAGRLLVVSQEPARPPSSQRSHGAVAVLQDRTELQRLDLELHSTRTLTEALRAQTHEHANRMHTMISLLELNRLDEALTFATEDLQLNQDLVDEVVSAHRDPVLAAIIMGKLAQAGELGIRMDVDWEQGASCEAFDAHDITTIVGNLLDNALDAALDSGTAENPGSRWVRLEVRGDAESTAPGVVLRVSDSGPGLGNITPQQVIERGFSTKESDASGRGIGLALVHQSVYRLGGRLEISSAADVTVTLPSSDIDDADDTESPLA
ncbi:ATP-binding protein [Acaricomes phytoseiuli]|uniref:sensor histidine kinase n=1 Tax=Acaricomes phytoseiuli TaxID=291968 RepID=UPI0022226D72|nr:ATP-binding protein [Acaricomes phytoseiuli]MCW1249450.1 ATP-binding protein [Acaricomes phytoseiuli]